MKKKIIIFVIILLLSIIFFWNVRDLEINKINRTINILNKEKSCSRYFLQEPIKRSDNDFKINALYSPLNPNTPELEMFNLPMNCIQSLFDVMLKEKITPLNLGSEAYNILVTYKSLLEEYYELLEETKYFVSKNGGMKKITRIIKKNNPRFYEDNIGYYLTWSYLSPSNGDNIYANPQYIDKYLSKIQELRNLAKEFNKYYRKHDIDLAHRYYYHYELILKSHKRILVYLKRYLNTRNYYVLSWVYRTQKEKDNLLIDIFPQH